MKQIQKCPHCHKDSVFSHNICPNCGFESKYEERGEPDYKLDENGKVPSYAFVMEEHMTQCQRHGRILLGVIMGLLGAPLLTWALAGKTVDVDVAGMLLSILWVVILPIVVGLTVKWIWPKFTEKATDYLPAVSSIAIALIVAIVIGANASKLMAGGLVIVVVVVLHNLCGLSLGYLIGRMLGLSEPKKRAISIEVGMQNSGLASSLATIHFAAYPLATIPGAIFSVWHNISGAMVAYLYRKNNTFKTIN